MADPLRFFVRPVLRDAPLVLAFAGWNDAGEAATYAARFLDSSIRAVPLAEIDAEAFLDLTVQRPTVRLDGEGERIIEWPRLLLRYGSVDPSREIAVGIGVEPHVQWRRFADLVARVVEELEIRRVVLLGAYVADVLYSRPVGVTGFASDPKLLDRIGVLPTGYEGPTGIVGVLAERLRRDDVELISLWAGLPHYINAVPNPRGALALVQKLVASLEIAVDVEPLHQEAANFEQKIAAEVAADPELEEYVRQLKRREFAQ